MYYLYDNINVLYMDIIVHINLFIYSIYNYIYSTRCIFINIQISTYSYLQFIFIWLFYNYRTNDYYQISFH